MADLSLMQSEYLVADAEEAQREEHFHELHDDLHGGSSLDEGMPPLQRVEKYAKSDQPFDRQMVPRVMQAAFRSAPPEQLTKDLPHLMQIICKIADEDEITVRSDLLEQIPNLAEASVECAGRCPALATLVADYLLPLVVRHLTTLEYHVLKVAQHSLLALMERSLVTKVQAEIQVCPTILSLSRREQEKELGMDFQSSAVTLMSKMAPLLGRDVMERVFLERFADLCANATFNIKKVCAMHLSDFAAVVGKEAYENVLLPSYLSLCADKHWSVRKACAEAAVGVSCVCPTSSVRHCTLAPLYTRLLRDSSRWVRTAAFQGLGPFISTFAQQPGGVTTLSYNAQGELVLMNKYGCEFEIHSITPAIEDMKHFVNMSVISDEPEIDYGDGLNISERYGKSASAGLWSSAGNTSLSSNDVDSDSDDGGQSILDIDQQLSTLCVYNRAVKMEESNQEQCARSREFGGFRDPRLSPRERLRDLARQHQMKQGTIDDWGNMYVENSPKTTKIDEGQENTSMQQQAANTASYAQIASNRTKRDYFSTLQSSGDGNNLLASSSISSQQQLQSASSSKIILFKGDVLTPLDTDHSQLESKRDTALKSSGPSIDPSCRDNSSKNVDDVEQYNSYYYWYVSPDMPLDPDIVDAGIPMDSLMTLTSNVATAAPDVVPQREPQASPSMNNLNDEGLNSSNSSSLLRNNGGNNICDLLSTTINVINTENNENQPETSSENTNALTQSNSETFTFTSSFLNHTFELSYQRQPSDNNQQSTASANSTFTVHVDDKAATSEEGGGSESMIVPEPAQHIVPQQLIDHFTSMTHRQLEENTNTHIAYYCAYSLPAVALTLGSENWHLLQGTVEALAQHAYYKVRLTVASCLHELAVILGQEIASEYLTVIFDGFIKDLDEVRIGILKHMAHFLILISPAKRRHYLGLFVEFLRIDNKSNWRFQLQLAIQLRLAVPLYRPLDVLRHIFSIGLVLLHHGVAVARRTAIMLVTEVFKYCNKKKNTTSNLLVKVAETLAHATLWKLRQTFAMLAAELVRQEALPPPVFAVEVLPHLLDLSWDPVAVVRLSVGRTIATHIITTEYYRNPANQHFDTLQTVLRRLQSDKDRDVRDFSSFVVKENETGSLAMSP